MVPVTVTLTVLPSPTPCRSPVKVRTLVPAMTSEPPHGAVVPLGAVRPAGRVSVKLIPDSALQPVGVLISTPIVVVLPRPTLAGPNDLAIVGGAGTPTPTLAV